jgi:hypothetical protein
MAGQIRLPDICFGFADDASQPHSIQDPHQPFPEQFAGYEQGWTFIELQREDLHA